VELRSFNLTREDPMTENSLPLAALLAKAGDPDFLRQAAETVVKTNIQCGATQSACDKLAPDFKKLDDAMRQNIQSHHP
jgi:hypothetical protein